MECGAGTGYWAALLRRRGVDVVAHDARPPGRRIRNDYHRGMRQPWTAVGRAASADAVRRHRGRLLFLCRPPLYDDSASYAALQAYRGEVLVCVGEPGEGTSGTLRFQRELKLNWTLVEQVKLPGWPWLRDCLMVYRRNPVQRRLTERYRCFECKRYPHGRHRTVRLVRRAAPASDRPEGREPTIRIPGRAAPVRSTAFRTALEESPSRIR